MQTVLRDEGVHLFGVGLGGFMAQCFAADVPGRVRSLFLCGSYAETGWFARRAWLPYFQYYPATLLRRLVLSSFDSGAVETRVRRSIDFQTKQVDQIDRKKLASRLRLNCTADEVTGVGLDDRHVTLMSVMDSDAVPDELRLDLAKRYPRARAMDLKDGGDFPFLSRAPELAALIELHLRRFDEAVNAGTGDAELDSLLEL